MTRVQGNILIVLMLVLVVSATYIGFQFLQLTRTSHRVERALAEVQIEIGTLVASTNNPSVDLLDGIEDEVAVLRAIGVESRTLNASISNIESLVQQISNTLSFIQVNGVPKQ